MPAHTPYGQTGSTAVIAPKKNPSGETSLRPPRCTSNPSTARENGRSPIASGGNTRLGDAILAELQRCGIPADHAGPPLGPCAWWPGGRAPAPPQPIIVGGRAGSDAIVVAIERSSMEFMFGDTGGARAGLPLLLRATRGRSFENRLCETTTATATAIEARRLLIVCDAARTSPAQRTRAIRWVREVAHRIGYESSINGLQDLATSYLILVAATEPGDATQSVVDWYRGERVR